MTITWFGHSCFRIESKEGSSTDSTGSRQAGFPRPELGTKAGQVSILIDPFSKDIGLKPPRIKDDLVLVTHKHYDHNNVEDAPPQAMIIDGPGEYEKQGIYVRGIFSYHDKVEGKERGFNTIYVIKAEEMMVCHMGDFGQAAFEKNQLDEIGDVDILMLPVGGKYTIDYKEAVQIVEQIEPKIIIPMHYKTRDLKLDIDGSDKFVKELGLTPEKVDPKNLRLGASKYKIAKKNLPVEEMKLILFQN